jgi:hypothetical protein
MSLLKYNDYITEKVAYELLLESKMVFSKKFINLLNKMKSNKIASELLNLYSKDVKISHNYIDITDAKDAVSFTPDRKAQEILKDKPQLWEVIDSQRYLTHSNGNNKLFEALGYEKPSGEPWAPVDQTIGIILGETISESSGKIYVIFEEDDTDSPRKTVLNKESLEETDSSENSKIWSTSRNKIKVGRLVRAVLKASGLEFLDKDIEEFTNTYKATFDFAQDVLKQFDIVKGEDIAYWYDNSNEDRYVDGGGVLNSSCMAESPSEFFDMYCNNTKEIQMVILYGDDGEIKGNGVFKSDQIKGRALLWKATIDGTEGTFMDRIYTTNDSDVELFKQYAEKNNWWYKKSQTMDPSEKITNGSTSKSAVLVVKLTGSGGKWTRYPYMDTMCYLSFDHWLGSLTNDRDGDLYINRTFRDTDGCYMDDDGDLQCHD